MEILHGFDGVYLPRIQVMVRRHGLSFARSFLTPRELDLLPPMPWSQLQEGASIDPRSLNRFYELLGGRFAAKEACLKALGTGFGQAGMGLRSLEIRYNPMGQPACHFLGKVADRAKDLGIFSHSLSLSHEGDYAFASFVALAEGVRTEKAEKAEKAEMEQL